MFSFGMMGMPVAHAATPDPADKTYGNYGLDASAAQFTDKQKDPDALPKLIGGVISVVLQLLGVVFVIIVVYAGFQWMIAEGDSGKIGEARGMIFHAIVGLIITMSAYAITQFVISNIAAKTIGPG